MSNVVQMQTDWISFAKQRPPLNRYVLVCCLNGLMAIAKLIWWPGDSSPDSAGYLWETPEGDGSHLEDLNNPVTHWMSKPAPPPGRKRVRERPVRIGGGRAAAAR